MTTYDGWAPLASPRDAAFEGGTIRDGAHLDVMDRLVAIDLEASGLHVRSYPIELGWALVSDPSRSGSRHVRPVDGWSVYDWDAEAEAVHGTRRDDLFVMGTPPDEVVSIFEGALPERAILVSDAPGHDEDWLHKLYIAAGRTRMPLVQMSMAVGCGLVHDRLPDTGFEGAVFAHDRIAAATDFTNPSTHRARDDAVNVATTLHRCGTEPLDDLRRLATPPEPPGASTNR